MKKTTNPNPESCTMYGMISPDHLVIGCHPEVAEIHWVHDGTLLRCSECGSIHPDEFIKQIRHGDFVCGFLWEGGKQPLRAVLGGYNFASIHLQDMSIAWMYENAMTIFEATGVLFYWVLERMEFNAAEPFIRLGRGSDQFLTDAHVEEALDMNEHFYRLHRRELA